MRVRTTPHLAEGEERQAGSAPAPVRTVRSAGAPLPQPRDHAARPRSTAPLLTPAVLLIDANGSVRSRRSLFLFCHMEIPS